MRSRPGNPLQQTDRTLHINEIFHSIQGESLKTGLPSVFIRLTGCPLRCSYCDTVYAFHDGKKMNIDAILTRVIAYRTRHVTVTGGEPLAQKNCIALLTRLCDEGLHVSLETSGALALDRVDPRVMKIVDIKTPGSGETDKNKFHALDDITPRDQIKFVICDRNDYKWSVQKTNEYRLADRCEVLFSPSYDQLPPKTLAEWILEDEPPVRLQLQIHKFLWGEARGH